MHIPFFRIFYSTSFTIISLFLLTLLLITPVDHIRQAFRDRKIYDIFIIAGAYLLTLLVSVLLYASRLFGNRSVLASIPRPWSPVENGDVNKRMRHLIAEGLKNSAVIAYRARPRDLSDEQRPEGSIHGDGDNSAATNPTPIWGIISHPGWSSPSSPDLPNLHYDPVIHELAHLIEAKAVSLAPVTTMPTEAEELPPPDPLAVELLQRPATMGLRDYVWHLTSLGMIHPSSLGDDFLSIYEKARFSNRPLDETDFRALMRIFAAMLRGMTTLDPDTILEHTPPPTNHLPSSSSSSSLSDPNTNPASLNSNLTVQHTPQPHPLPSPSFSQPASPTTTTNRSRSPGRKPTKTTASRPRPAQPSSRSASPASQINDPHLRNSSLTSLRPVHSHASYESSGSVIRLAEARAPLDLPYVFFDASERPI